MQVEGLEIPDEWCWKLKELQLTDPNAIIAGGAIRDLFCGQEIKDIDFFTSGDLPDWGLEQPEEKMDYEGMKYVEGVLVFKGPPILNVIKIAPTDPMDLLLSFDMGFCQIGFNGEYIIKTPAFLWDNKYQLITLRHIDRYSRSLLRYARINQRYSRTLVIPELDELNAKFIPTSK